MKKVSLVLIVALIIMVGGNIVYANSVWNEDYVRSNFENGAGMEVIYLNPLVGDKYPDNLAFRIYGTTHSGTLSGEFKEDNIEFKTSEGQMTDKIELVWESKSSHHPRLLLLVDKVMENGKPLITEDTESITINFKEIRDVEDRELKWTKGYGLRAGIITNNSGKYSAYISNASSGTITQVDIEDHSILDEIKIGEKASHGVTGVSNGKYFYGGTGDKKELVILNKETGELVKKIKVDSAIHGIDISPDGKEIYLAGGSFGVRGSVLVYDSESQEIVDKINTKGAGHITFSNDGRYAYVSNHDKNEMIVINTKRRTVVNRIPVGKGPNKGIISKDGNYLYVANHTEGTISVVDLEIWQEIKKIESDIGAHDLDQSIDGRYLWVANSDGRSITVFDTTTYEKIKTIEPQGGVNHIAMTPDGNYIYVTDPIKDQLIVINTDTYQINKQITIGSEPHEIVFLR